MKILIILGAILIQVNVWASGQCDIVSSGKAKLAAKILESEKQKQNLFVIDQYCEACMDEFPMPFVVETIESKPLKFNALSQVLINGIAIDMAYVYINGENLAEKIGCKTIAVSKNLD